MPQRPDKATAAHDGLTNAVRFDIISQGEELLSGQATDTNAGWISSQLLGLGMKSGRVVVVGDDLDDIREVIAESASRARVVVCTGGLGPTSDDLTREAAASAFGVELDENVDAVSQIEARYRSRNRPMPPANRVQALLPRGATLLENEMGTAPGFSFDTGTSLLFFFPGVPFEMKPMVERFVLPAVRERFALPASRTMYLRCVNLAESVAAGKMEGFEREGVIVGYRASFPEVQVKLHVSAGLNAEALVEEALDRLGRNHVFGVNTGNLAEVVLGLLRARGQTVAVAESCTGGRVMAELTAIPGASSAFVGGAVVYSNLEKTRQCGVPADLIAEHGAVSEPVARRLAEGIRESTGAIWGIGITGVAGPSGGTREKPVGTVHFAVCGAGGTTHSQLRLPYDRLRNLGASTAFALDLLRLRLLAA